MKKRWVLLFLCFVFCADVESFAEDRSVIDSLKQVLSSSVSDSNKVLLFKELALQYRKVDVDSSFIMANKGAELAEKCSYAIGKEKCLSLMGTARAMQGDFEAALDLFKINRSLCLEIGQSGLLAINSNNIGLVHYYMGNYGQAIDHYLQAVKVYEQEGDNPRGLASTLNNIGLVYEIQKKLDRAAEFHQRALRTRREIGNKQEIGYSLANLGNVYFKQKKYDKALGNFLNALKLFKATGDQYSLAKVNTNIGSVYKIDGYPDKAIKYFEDGIKQQEDLGDVIGMTANYFSVSEALQSKQDYTASIPYAMKSLEYAQASKAKTQIQLAASALADAYESLGNYAQALKYTDLYIATKDSIAQEANAQQIEELQTQYETEQKEKEIALLTTENELKEVEANRSRIFTYGVLAILFMIIVFSIFIIKAYRQKKKAFIQLEHTNEKVLRQKDIIEEKNTDITDSIEYAQRIQDALLVPEEHVSKHLPEHFILYRPRDIVSGDFYWASEKHGKLLVAVADCTGHGVPGAMMSMLGMAFLNDIAATEEDLSPVEILTELRQKIVGSLGISGHTKDGMDMSLFKLDTNSNELEFAGANNSLYIINNGDINQLPADRQPVGHHIEMRAFTLRKHIVEKGDMIYAFSDGYPDQFGGAKGKKFKINQLQKLLVDISTEEVHKQKEILNTTFEEWKGAQEQIDDICLMGMRV